MSININQLVRENQPAKSNGKVEPNQLKALLDREITIFPVRFTDKQKEAFYLELATLLTAGLDIKSSLEMIENEQASKKHAAIINKLINDLVKGNTLSQAMKLAGYFTPYEYYAVQIGEEAGKLLEVLNQLHQYFANRLKQRRQFISALSYPIIILITSIGAVSFMLLFIVPMFEDVFKRFGGELPGITKFIIGFASSLQSNALYILLVVVVFVLVLYSNRKKTWLRKLTSNITRNIPVVGKIIYALQLARFCNSMSLLLGAKVPVLNALQLVNQMIEFYPVQSTLKQIEDDILRGIYLHQSMAKFPVFNRRMVSLIKIGEEVNKLDLFFDKLAKQYSSDAEHQTGQLNTFLEPAMIIFLGMVVGFILLAMYLPMFQMSTNIGS